MASADLFVFLSKGICADCCKFLKARIDELVASGATFHGIPLLTDASSASPQSLCLHTPSKAGSNAGSPPSSSPSSSLESTQSSAAYGSALRRGLSPGTPSPTTSSNSTKQPCKDGEVSSSPIVDTEIDDLSEAGSNTHREQREWVRFSRVGRKKDFRLIEKIKGRNINILQGLELHKGVFNAKEQERIVRFVYALQKQGRERKLRDRTFSEPRKWMRGKGRVTLQFGCCYNYATDQNGNPPGILRDEEVDPLPLLFKLMIKRMVRWHILPASCVPNSCIVNIYDEGDCIPPHIDHHDFLRPFCTVSFLAECNILFGHNIEVAGPGEFKAPVAIPLPVGSVFILNGNGADVAKHCVPGVPAKRISITFRKMDEAKIPYSFTLDPDLQGIRPLAQPPSTLQPPKVQQSFAPILPHQHALQQQQRERHNKWHPNPVEAVTDNRTSGISLLSNDDFPSLGGSSSANRKTNVPPPRRPIRQ